MNKRKRWNRFFTILGILACAFVVTSSSLPVSAGSEDEVMKKTLYNAARYCMQDKFTKKEVNVYDINNSSGNANVILQSQGKKNTIYLPTNYGNNVSNSSITCQEAFNGIRSLTGKVKFQGALDVFGKSIDSSTITSIGYSATSDGINQKCLQIQYTTEMHREEYQKTNKVCFPVDKNDKIIIDSEHAVDIGGSQDKVGQLYLRYDGSTGTVGLYLQRKVSGGSTETLAPSGVSIAAGRGTAWKDVVNTVDITELLGVPLDELGDKVEDVNIIKDDGASGTSVTKYVKKDELNAGNQIVRFLTNDTVKTVGAMQFTEKEKYDIYMSYVDKLRSDDKISIVAAEACTTKKPSKGWAVWDGNKWCEVKKIGDGDISDKFTMVKSGNPTYPGFEGNKSFNAVMKALMSLNYKDASFDGVDFSIGSAGSSTSSSEDPDEDVSVACSKTGVLSWITCPVIQLFYDGIMGMYSYIESNFLEIKANYLLTNGNSQENAVYEGWKKFRDFANIAFVIMLVIVILSQVTGFGISNYGIKKALPKLIVVAILVNLSFLFCQLAVDVSNILGYALRSMFRSIANDVGGTAFELPSMLRTIVTVGLFGAGTGALLYFTDFWKTWVPVLLTSLVGVLIGVLFFFIVLGVRQAGVLILVVISPIAIICYALPNTKSLFDRWKKTLTSLLLVFPICGALMGGGQLAATIIASSPGYTIEEDIEEMKKNEGTVSVSTGITVVASIPATHFADTTSTNTEQKGQGTSIIMGIIAMLVQVAPFFMVPSLVRNSMNALGNIGNKLTQTGARWGRGASNALGKTEAMQDFQRRMEMSRDRGLLKRMDRQLQGRNGVKIGGRTFFRKEGRDLSARQNRQYARLASRRGRMLNEDETAAAHIGKSYMENSPEYAALKANAQTAAMNTAIKEQESLVKSDTSLSGNTQRLEDELYKSMEDLDRNPEDTNALARAQALQNILMAKGNDGRGHLDSAYARAIHDNKMSGLNKLASSAMDANGNTFKNNALRTFQMLQQLASMGDEITDMSASGARERFRDAAKVQYDAATGAYSTGFDSRGLKSMSADKLTNGDDILHDTIIREIKNGNLRGDVLDKVAFEAQKALDNPQNKDLKGDVRAKLQTIAGAKQLQGNTISQAFETYNSTDPSVTNADRNQALQAIKNMSVAMSGTSSGRYELKSQLNRQAALGRTHGIQEAAAAVTGSRDFMQNYSNASAGMRQMLTDAASGNLSHLTNAANQTTHINSNGGTVHDNKIYDQQDLYDNHPSASSTSMFNANTNFAETDMNDLAYLANTASAALEDIANGATPGVGMMSQSQLDSLVNHARTTLRTNPAMKSPENAARAAELNKILKAAGKAEIDPNNIRERMDPGAPPAGFDPVTGKFEEIVHDPVTHVISKNHTPNSAQQAEWNNWIQRKIDADKYNKKYDL